MKNQSLTESVVFVVDDDASVRDSLGSLFRSVGLRVELFGSADEFLQGQHPDAPCCLVLDVRLPGLSGLEFQTELIRTGKNVPIIFLTGHGDIPMTVKAMKAGAVEFFTKPVREQDLLDAINVALERDRARRENDDRLRQLKTRFQSLSDREREVLTRVIAGMLNKQIAGEMKLSEVTVKVHRHNLMKKLGAKSVPGLVRMADTLGVVPRTGGAA